MTGEPSFRRRGHDEARRYVVYVLWLIGHSQRGIATALGLRTKQVAGIIDGSGAYRNRAAMSGADRQQHLTDLESIRLDDAGVKLDGGRLDKVHFLIRPLGGRQARGALRRKVRRGV